MNALKDTRVTAIGSGKGGTGKTMLAANLACALAQAGERVLLCDADLGLANAAIHLGLEHGGDLRGVLSGSRPLGDAVVSVFGGARASGGFDLLAAPSGSGALANVSIDAVDRLTDILKDAAGYDRVLLDLGAGVDAATIRFAAAADEVMLALTPDPAALTDAYAFVKLVLRLGAPIPAFVVNMAAGEAEARQVADALIGTCRAFLKRTPEQLGVVPRDSRATESIRQQALLLKLYPQAPASRATALLARRLHARLAPQLALVGGASPLR